MSMILVFADEPSVLDTERLALLGRLGITSVTLLEEASIRGVLIQGWAFERTSAREAVEILTSGASDVRVLEPVMQVSVSPWAFPVPAADTVTTEKERG